MSIKKIGNYIGTSVLVCIGLFFLIPLLPISGVYQLRVVTSGSMEPAIHTGSMAVVYARDSYGVGDVITFLTSGASLPTSHRIVSVKQEGGATLYQTKGDANDDPDYVLTDERNVLGKVVFSIPFLGYAIVFLHEPSALAALAIAILVFMVGNEARKFMVRRKQSPNDESEQGVGEELPI